MGHAVSGRFALVINAGDRAVGKAGVEADTGQASEFVRAGQGKLEGGTARESTGCRSTICDIVHHAKLQVRRVNDVFLTADMAKLEVGAQPQQPGVMIVNCRRGGSNFFAVTVDPLVQIGEAGTWNHGPRSS